MCSSNVEIVPAGLRATTPRPLLASATLGFLPFLFNVAKEARFIGRWCVANRGRRSPIQLFLAIFPWLSFLSSPFFFPKRRKKRKRKDKPRKRIAREVGRRGRRAHFPLSHPISFSFFFFKKENQANRIVTKKMLSSRPQTTSSNQSLFLFPRDKRNVGWKEGLWAS